MEYFGLAILAAAALACAWWLSKRLGRSKRNQGSEHGGGIDGYPGDAPLP
jgi:hypothetical protein